MAVEAVDRRAFLRLSGTAFASLAAALWAEPVLATLRYLPQVIPNPLDYYPNRDWERIYRDQFGYDETFHFLCAPNDTHNCLLRAYVKNGVITRLGPSYGYGRAEDIYGNRASSRWEPRLCQKGLVMNRKVYGPRRAKYPAIREGFRRWADAGFPRDSDGSPPREYVLGRGKEPFIRLTWDEAFDYAAKALVNIAQTYTGEKGTRLLSQQGYDPAVVAATDGIGTQVLKLRGGMPLLGITRVFGMYRLANSFALLDAKLRNVQPEEAVGARGFDNYSWHTDLPPGHPMVTGQQTPEGCFVDGFRTSLGAMALAAYDDSAAGKALECLPSQQNGDGSFGRLSNRSNAMDTALALLALQGESVLRGE